MYKCPACGKDDVTGLSRCRCGADLTLLQTLDGVADVWFNYGLEALNRGAPGEALEWFSACCAARPTDAPARRAQAKVWAQLGHFREARDALKKAELLDPDDRDLKDAAAAVDEAVKREESSR
jgi:Flp pilus assembly protein TadD